MSKSSVLEIALGAAAAAAGFWGLPALFPEFFQAGTMAMTVSTGVGIMGVSAALQGVAGLLAPGQPVNLGPDAQLPITQPNLLWRVIYGVFQSAAEITFVDDPVLVWSGTGNGQPCNNQYLHQVHTIACHQVAGYLAVVIEGQTYNFGTDLVYNPGSPYGLGVGSYWAFTAPNNPWTGHIFFEFDTGCPANTAQPFPSLVAGANQYAPQKWTAAALQRGRAKVHVLIHYVPANQGTVNSASGIPEVLGAGRVPKIEFRVAGRIIQDVRVETTWQAATTFPQYSVVLTPSTPNYQAQAWVQMTSGSPTSGNTAPNFAGNPTVGTVLTDGGCSWRNVGVPDYAITKGNVIGPKLQPTAFPGNVCLFGDAWQSGVAYAQYKVIEAPIGYLQMATTGGTSSTTGAPGFTTSAGGTATDGSITWTSVGRSIFATVDRDSDGTQNFGGISNPALCAYDYLTTPANLFGLGVPFGDPDTIASVIAAANICDEAVLIMYTGTAKQIFERQFTCNGMFETSSTRGDVLKSLCMSMAGFAVPPGDTWRIFAGSYVAPTFSLDDDDLRGPLKGDFRLSARDACNGVKGSFIAAFLPINPLGPLINSPASPSWQWTSFPPYQSATHVAEDGGQVIWKDIKLDFTTSLWMAQRIAKIVLEQARRQQTLTVPCKLSALALIAGDTVEFSHARWGLTSAVYQVQALTLTADTHNETPTLGVDLVLRQTDAGVYEFAPPTSSSAYGDYSPYGQTGIGAPSL